ncbi:hypothetical protein Esti_002415 [Eimeria stiedai]
MASCLLKLMQRLPLQRTLLPVSQGSTPGVSVVSACCAQRQPAAVAAAAAQHDSSNCSRRTLGSCRDFLKQQQREQLQQQRPFVLRLSRFVSSGSSAKQPGEPNEGQQQKQQQEQRQGQQQEQQQPQQHKQQQQQQQHEPADSVEACAAKRDAVAATAAAAAAAAAAARPDLHALRFPSIEAAAARAAHRHEVEAAAAAAAAAAGEAPPKASLPPSSGRLVTWRVALFCSAACAAMTALVAFEMKRKRSQRAAITESITVGKPLLGGPWTLVDGSAVLRSSSDFSGKYQLIYFGFSFCPDICPKELEKLAQVINLIDKEHGEVVQPIFITVDPARDTVAQVAEYCKEFHPRLIGLTGTPSQIKDVTRKFRVYFNETARTGDENYLVDHSIIQYFMGRDGSFKDFFGQNMTAREVAERISQHIKTDKLRDQNKKRKFITWRR